jgi:hypothetical protein
MPDSRLPSAFRNAALALLLLLACAGCEGRLRSNPLDPKNPSTGGGPIGFVALADFSVVHLKWSAAANSQIAGFLVERKEPGPDPFVAIVGVLPPNAAGYDDTDVTNDIDYQYRLSYLLPGGGTTGTPARSDARPARRSAGSPTLAPTRSCGSPGRPRGLVAHLEREFAQPSLGPALAG